MPLYTHTCRRYSTGHRSSNGSRRHGGIVTTANAGKQHAAIAELLASHAVRFRTLCGETVSVSAEEIAEPSNDYCGDLTRYYAPATEDHAGVTCRRCKRIIAAK